MAPSYSPAEITEVLVATTTDTLMNIYFLLMHFSNDNAVCARSILEKYLEKN